MEDRNKEQGMNVELPESIAEGVYSNLVITSHSSAEFVLDFIRIVPGLPKAKVVSRIIMNPQHAKRLLYALQDNISKYEKSYGPIEIPDGGSSNFPPTFGGPKGFA